MINNNKNAWIITRETDAALFGRAKEQMKALQGKLATEGFSLSGVSNIHSPIDSVQGLKELGELMGVANKRNISAVFVFSISTISSDLTLAFEIVDKLNEFGIVVYDIEGYEYSYDWYCKQIGKRFK